MNGTGRQTLTHKVLWESITDFATSMILGIKTASRELSSKGVIHPPRVLFLWSAASQAGFDIALDDFLIIVNVRHYLSPDKLFR
ncbi:hypothetical protein JHU04_003780 [Brenneria sp. 4F2]|nr:hypothetical protein [Brenneria bubanii]